MHNVTQSIKQTNEQRERFYFTCAGTALPNVAGISFTLKKTFNVRRIDPVNTLTKKTFHIVKYKTLRHALRFRPLREIDPSRAENDIIVGGTRYINRINMTLGKYPVTSSLIYFLHNDMIE